MSQWHHLFIIDTIESNEITVPVSSLTLEAVYGSCGGFSTQCSVTVNKPLFKLKVKLGKKNVCMYVRVLVLNVSFHVGVLSVFLFWHVALLYFTLALQVLCLFGSIERLQYVYMHTALLWLWIIKFSLFDLKFLQFKAVLFLTITWVYMVLKFKSWYFCWQNNRQYCFASYICV